MCTAANQFHPQNPESKPDYKKQTMHELDKLQAKVILLNDLLDNVDTSKGERFVKGDAYDVRDLLTPPKVSLMY